MLVFYYKIAPNNHGGQNLTRFGPRWICSLSLWPTYFLLRFQSRVAVLLLEDWEEEKQTEECEANSKAKAFKATLLVPDQPNKTSLADPGLVTRRAVTARRAFHSCVSSIADFTLSYSILVQPVQVRSRMSDC